MTAILILWLVPAVGWFDAAVYGQAIDTAARDARISPRLMVALAYRESRFRPWLVSRRNYGLFQVRVSRTTLPEWRGREHGLFDPTINARHAATILTTFRRYHRRRCARDHAWWAHYQWGWIVRDPRSGERVRRVYDWIEQRVAHAARARS